VRIRTNNGCVDVELSGGGDAEVDTQSSAIRIRCARGSVNVSSQSSRGAVSTRRAIGGGGPVVRAPSRSVTVRMTVAPRGHASRSFPIAPATRAHGEAIAFAPPESTYRPLHDGNVRRPARLLSSSGRASWYALSGPSSTHA
jgi:hypothetical protein